MCNPLATADKTNMNARETGKENNAINCSKDISSIRATKKVEAKLKCGIIRIFENMWWRMVDYDFRIYNRL